MASRDFGFITLRNIAAYQGNGNPVPPNQVLVTSGTGNGGFTNSLIISTICVSTVEVSTIYIQNEIGSTITTNYLTVNSTANISSLNANTTKISSLTISTIFSPLTVVPNSAPYNTSIVLNVQDGNYATIESFANDNVSFKKRLALNPFGGNVGVGLTSTLTTEKLSVGGDLLVRGGTQSTSRLILGPSPDTNNYDYCSVIECNSNIIPLPGNEGSDLRFYTHGTAPTYGMPDERMRITNQGNVYINSTLYVASLNTNQISTSNIATNFVSTFNHIALFDGTSSVILDAQGSTLYVNGHPIISGGGISSVSSLFWLPGPNGTLYNENIGTAPGNFYLVGIGTNGAALNATLDVAGTTRVASSLTVSSISNVQTINTTAISAPSPSNPYFINYSQNIDSGTLPYPVLRFNSLKAGGTQNKSLTLLMDDGVATWTSQWETYLMQDMKFVCQDFWVSSIQDINLESQSTIYFDTPETFVSNQLYASTFSTNIIQMTQGQVTGLSTINGIAWPPVDDALWSGSLAGNIYNDNTGNVAIGLPAVSATEKLTVNSTMLIRCTESSTARLVLGAAPNTNNYDYCAVIEGIGYPNNETTSLAFYTQKSGGTAGMPPLRMLIDPNGDVFIYSTLNTNALNTNHVSSGNISTGLIATGLISTNTIQMNSGNIYTNGGTIYGLSGINNSLSGGNLNIDDTNITIANGSLTIPSANYYISTNNLNMTNGQITGLSSIYMTNGQIYSNSDVLSLTGNTDGEAGLKLFNGQAKIITNTNYDGMYLEASENRSIILCSTNASPIYASFGPTNIISSQTSFLQDVDITNSLSTNIINMTNGQINGISTINPQDKLQVNGNFGVLYSGGEIQPFKSNNGNYIYIDTATDTQNVRLGAFNSGGSRPLCLQTGASGTQDNLVAIGKLAPQFLLDVGGSIRADSYLSTSIINMSSLGTNNGQIIGLSTINGIAWPPKDDALWSGSLSGDIYNDNIGNVGIGTTATEKLSVRSTILVTGPTDGTSRLILGPSPGTNNYDYCSLIEAFNYKSNHFSSDLRFYTHGEPSTNGMPSERMRIDQFGAVTIFSTLTTLGLNTNTIQMTNGVINPGGSNLTLGGPLYVSSFAGNMAAANLHLFNGAANFVTNNNFVGGLFIEVSTPYTTNFTDLNGINTYATIGPTINQFNGNFKVVYEGGELQPFQSNNNGNYLYLDMVSNSQNIRLGAYSSGGSRPLCLQTGPGGTLSDFVAIGKFFPQFTLDVAGTIKADTYLSTNTINMNSGSINFNTSININPLTAAGGNVNIGTQNNPIITLGSSGSTQPHIVNGNLNIKGNLDVTSTLYASTINLNSTATVVYKNFNPADSNNQYYYKYYVGSQSISGARIGGNSNWSNGTFVSLNPGTGYQATLLIESNTKWNCPRTGLWTIQLDVYVPIYEYGSGPYFELVNQSHLVTGNVSRNELITCNGSSATVFIKQNEAVLTCGFIGAGNTVYNPIGDASNISNISFRLVLPLDINV